MNISIRGAAFRLLDRRPHLGRHSQELWLYYLLGTGYIIDKYHAPHSINREEASQLVKEYRDARNSNQ